MNNATAHELQLSAPVLMHDGMTFPNQFLFNLIEPKPVTHELADDGTATIAFYADFYIGSDEQATNKYADYISRLKHDSSVTGLILEMYSGGGTDVAGELLRTTIADFSRAKPVIVHAQTIGSAAYLAASAANLIIATNNLSRFGSIGAYLTLPKWYAEIYAKIFQDVYADASTEKNKAWRDYVENQENFAAYKDLAERSAKYFQHVVKKARTYVQETALTGAMYEAEKAKTLGLIDGIGTRTYVMNRLKSLRKAYQNA